VIGQLLVGVRLLGCLVGWLVGVAGVSPGQTVSVRSVWMNENADVLPPGPHWPSGFRRFCCTMNPCR
jgi:hypothetical protein